MHKKFDHKEIEKKWQKNWEDSGIYKVGERDESKEKEYVLVEFSYPSGNLHIGHWFAFGVTDIYVRAHRMQGKQMFFPMGFDSFGLPAENAAIKHDKDPKEWTDSNIEHMTSQLKAMGNSFDWSSSLCTSDPEYYKWTQWVFTKFFEKDIAYRGTGMVNWCPSCNTVLANEQVLADDTCERCGTDVEKKEMEEWKMRITKYADRLIDDLEPLDWPEPIKESQRRWIGRSEGAEIPFKLSTGDEIDVFTTRPDTLFGATYMVFAPEHHFVKNNKEKISNWDEVEKYIEVSKKKSEQDRLDDTKEKTGVVLEGVTATNPANGKEIPVYIADYVLAGYGTGAIMAVPAHDERDFAFATKYEIPIKEVIIPVPEQEVTGVAAIVRTTDGSYLFQKRTKDAPTNPGKVGHFSGGVEEGEKPHEALARELEEELELDVTKNAQVRFLHNIDSPFGGLVARFLVDGVNKEELRLQEGEAIVEARSYSELVENYDATDHVKMLEKTRPLSKTVKEVCMGQGALINSGEFDGMDSEEAKRVITEKVGGRLTSTYRLRDWSVGRQRYWGVPVPIVYDPKGKPHKVPEEHLPWELPTDVDFKPTGEPPLAKSKELLERTEKIFGEGWTPAVETLDTFVDSSWYFLRYLDPKNNDALTSMSAQKEWMPIDLYMGGAEHTTMHLLYSRFWQKVLFDLGLVTTEEPYKKRVNRGLVLGPDGNKMSKSKGNVIDPDKQVEILGSDTVKMYLAFMGPYGESTNYPWDMDGITGLRRFLERVYGLNDHIAGKESDEVTKLLHKTIHKVSNDIEKYKFNTAISAMMVFINTAEKEGVSEATYKTFLQLLAPFAPHLTEELWHGIGELDSIHTSEWPKADESLLKDDTVTIGVQINGKMRGSISISPDATEENAVQAAKADESLSGKITSEPKKIIYVPARILNIIL